MLLYSILFLGLATVTRSDVIRSVYCKDQCSAYLQISESSMPSCDPDFLTMNFCGTVISCDPSDATKYQNRPSMNSTTFDCCYVTEVKQHGDCDPREVVAHNVEPRVVESPSSSSSVCAEASIAWLVALLLLIVVIIESAYIFYTLIFPQSHHKISQFAAESHVTCHNHPMIVARPLVNQHLLAQP